MGDHGIDLASGKNSAGRVGRCGLRSMSWLLESVRLPDETRLTLWEYYQILASDVLIRFGEFSPDIDYPEHNGHE